MEWTTVASDFAIGSNRRFSRHGAVICAIRKRRMHHRQDVDFLWRRSARRANRRQHLAPWPQQRFLLAAAASAFSFPATASAAALSPAAFAAMASSLVLSYDLNALPS